MPLMSKIYCKPWYDSWRKEFESTIGNTYKKNKMKKERKIDLIERIEAIVLISSSDREALSFR